MTKRQPKYMQDRSPDLTVKFWLVPHGYQASFYDTNGALAGETLRDFPESRPVRYWVDRLIALVLSSLMEMRAWPQAEAAEEAYDRWARTEAEHEADELQAEAAMEQEFADMMALALTDDLPDDLQDICDYFI